MVLPCVPATTSDVRGRRNSSARSAGRLVKRWRRSSTASTSGLPRDSALPMTTRSASSGTFASAQGERIGMPSASSCVDIGG